MTERETARLVATLITMRDLLPLVIGQQLDAEARALVAQALRTLADDLDPPEAGQMSVSTKEGN